MELKYKDTSINQFGDDAIVLRLNGVIGGEVNGSNFANEIGFVKNVLGKKPIIKINSPGGSVFDGISIIDAIEENEADTFVIGLAASMAGVIAQAGKNRFASKRAITMIHAVGGKDASLNEKATNIIKAELSTKTNFTEDKINELMSNGKDNFFDFTEMREHGLFDKEMNAKGVEAVNIDDSMTVNQIYDAFNQADEAYNTKINMTGLVNILELPENSSNERVAEVVKELKQERNTLKAANEALSGQVSEKEESITELTNKIEAFEGDKVAALVNKAIEDGKIKKEAKDTWLDLAKNNFDLASATLETLSTNGKVNVNAVTNQIDAGKSNDSNKPSMEDDAKEYLELAQTENGLQELFSKNEDKFDRISNAYTIVNKK